MQWEKIKSEYPIAFTKACQWQSNLGVELSMRDRISQEWRHGFRWLYDFFDKQEIFIEITFDRTMKRRFDALVFPEGMEKKKYLVKNGEKYFFSSRNEAEDAAFQTAFSLLESKLTHPAND